jgi:hypothetical protein
LIQNASILGSGSVAFVKPPGLNGAPSSTKRKNDNSGNIDNGSDSDNDSDNELVNGQIAVWLPAE